MQEKDIKRLVKKQLKKQLKSEALNWNRIPKKKKHLVKEVLEEVKKEYP